jgi:hypothetical protein
MHVLLGHTGCSANFRYRSSGLEAQDAAQVVIAVFPCVSRLGLRVYTIFLPESGQAFAQILDFVEIQAPSFDFILFLSP